MINFFVSLCVTNIKLLYFVPILTEGNWLTVDTHLWNVFVHTSTPQLILALENSQENP